MCKRQMRFLRYAVKSGIEECRRKAFIQGVKGVYVGGDSKVVVSYPVAFSKFAHPVGADLTGEFKTWSWAITSGSLTGCTLVSTHDARTMGVIAFGQ